MRCLEMKFLGPEHFGNYRRKGFKGVCFGVIQDIFLVGKAARHFGFN